MVRPRIREMGFQVGDLPPGPYDAITDVGDVRVGHTTLIAGEGPLHPGEGPIRTGVTIVLPHGKDIFCLKVRAAVHTINGFGKVGGFEQVRELGVVESPIALTNTLNVGLVADALVQHAVRQNPTIGIERSSPNVLVGETNDGYLNDVQGRHVHAEHVWAAIASATKGPVAEGVVGAGTGTTCFGWKGGIGTASRVVPAVAGGYVVGALVQSNFGRSRDLTICGVPVGRHIQPPETPPATTGDGGSVMIVLATDAPLSERQLGRLCVRAAAGLARTGSFYGHSSGDFVIAFTTAYHIERKPDHLTTSEVVLAREGAVMNWLFRAVVESVEEAVLNSLFRADTITGRDGNIRYGLPIDDVAALLRRYGPAKPIQE
jgi:D-aminopeptidase